MKITIDESLSIFQGDDGTDSVHRYDLPAEGVIEGWAIPAMVEQTKDLAHSWPDVEVVVSGDEQAAEILIRTLDAQGASATKEIEPSVAPETLAIHRPTQGRGRGKYCGISPVRLVLSISLVGGIALVWALVGGLTTTSQITQPSHTPSATQVVAPGAVAVSTVAEASTSSAPPASVVLVEQGLQVEAPFGSELRAGIVTGIDPELRVHLAVDPAEEDRSQMREALHHMIAADPALEIQVGGGVREEQFPISYVEQPGDGSTVSWITWFDAGQRISVGCHSRAEPQRAHISACAQIANSLTILGE